MCDGRLAVQQSPYHTGYPQQPVQNPSGFYPSAYSAGNCIFVSSSFSCPHFLDCLGLSLLYKSIQYFKMAGDFNPMLQLF